MKWQAKFWHSFFTNCTNLTSYKATWQRCLRAACDVIMLETTISPGVLCACGINRWPDKNQTQVNVTMDDTGPLLWISIKMLRYCGANMKVNFVLINRLKTSWFPRRRFCARCKKNFQSAKTIIWRVYLCAEGGGFFRLGIGDRHDSNDSSPFPWLFLPFRVQTWLNWTVKISK